MPTDEGAITFYQIRLPIGGANVITSPWGHASTGLAGRYLFSPDLGWHYCSAERLLTFVLLDVDFEREGRMEESNEEAEWWCEQADECLRELWQDGNNGELCYPSPVVCGPQPDDMMQRRELRGKFTTAVASSDVDLYDDGAEREDTDIWDEARDYACGNWQV